MDDMLNVCRTVSKLRLMDEGLEEDVDFGAGIISRDLTSVFPVGGYFGFRSETITCCYRHHPHMLIG